MASVSRMWARNWLPKPSPPLAPATSPAMSTNSMAAGMIDEETALAYSTRKAVLMRGIDAHKHATGEGVAETSGLRMSVGTSNSEPPPPVPRPASAPPVPLNLQMTK